MLDLYENQVPEKLRELYDQGKHGEGYNMVYELTPKLAQAHRAQLATL